MIRLNILGIKFSSNTCLGQPHLSAVGKVRESAAGRHGTHGRQVLGIRNPLRHSNFPRHVDKTLLLEIHRYIGVGKDFLLNIGGFNELLELERRGIGRRKTADIRHGDLAAFINFDLKDSLISRGDTREPYNDRVPDP